MYTVHAALLYYMYSTFSFDVAVKNVTKPQDPFDYSTSATLLFMFWEEPLMKSHS